MQGAHYGVDDIQALNSELLRVLQVAYASEHEGLDCFMLFELLESISPTYEQLKAIHDMRGV